MHRVKARPILLVSRVNWCHLVAILNTRARQFFFIFPLSGAIISLIWLSFVSFRVTNWLLRWTGWGKLSTTKMLPRTWSRMMLTLAAAPGTTTALILTILSSMMILASFICPAARRAKPIVPNIWHLKVSSKYLHFVDFFYHVTWLEGLVLYSNSFDKYRNNCWPDNLCSKSLSVFLLCLLGL